MSDFQSERESAREGCMSLWRSQQGIAAEKSEELKKLQDENTGLAKKLEAAQQDIAQLQGENAELQKALELGAAGADSEPVAAAKKGKK